MIPTRLLVALLTGLLTCPAASAERAPDLDRVAAALEALQASVNARDFGVLEARLDKSFSYQGRDPDLSRMIMRQVVQGYPHDIASISVLDVMGDGKSWSISVMIEGPEATEQRLILLSDGYRILQADIADIQLGGHDPQPAAQATEPNPEQCPDSMQFPFEVRGGQMVVQAQLNGVSGNFLVDTGAQATIANTVHFKPDELPTFALDHAMPSGVGGNMANVLGTRDLDLVWGDLKVDVARALAVDLSHLEESLGLPIVGLIGIDVLERFELRFDYTKGVLDLYRLGSNGQPVATLAASEPVEIIPFDMVGHIPVFTVQIAGQSLRLGLDSGASDAMLFEKWEDDLADEFEFIRTAEMRGADKSVRTSSEVRFDRMRVKNIDYRNMIFRFNDIVALAGNSQQMDGLLGFQFLSARPTSVNFRSRQIKIW